MALSFLTNMESLQYPELTSDHDQLLDCLDNFAFTDTLNITPFFELDELFNSDINAYTNLIPYFGNYSPSNNNTIMAISPKIFPLEDFDSYCYPKRQKSYDNHYYTDFTPNFLDGYLSNSMPIPEFLPEIPASVPVPVPKFQAPVPPFSAGNNDNQSSVNKSNGVSLSAQSIAARERRRRITDKTQELGKLIPGGNKLNTAEMLQASSKYVKFLQAQVKILKLMGSLPQRKETMHMQELQFLLVSPTIQEKLYSEEKCLVPREFVQVMAKDPEIQSQSMIIQELDVLLASWH